MNETLVLLLEALEGADRKALNEIALDEFEKDYSKAKLRNDEIRAELIELAHAKYEQPETGEQVITDNGSNDLVPPQGQAPEPEPEKPKVRTLKHRKTGRILTWTPVLAKRSGFVEVD
jgi:hypothetical protein